MWSFRIFLANFALPSLRRSRSDPFPALGGTKFAYQDRSRSDDPILMTIRDRKLRKLQRYMRVDGL
jgi:hypothetical protein